MSESKTHWGLRVLKFDYSDLAKDADPDVPYSTESVDYRVTAVGVEVTEAYPDLIVPFEPAKGEWLSVVCVRRSTGDSFHTNRGIFEPIAAYRSEPLALLAMAAIYEHNAMEERRLLCPHRLAILDEKGALFSVQVCWRGYFDALESVSVERLQVARA